MQTENNNADNLNEKKPVGYGSSMQTGGLGNRTRPEDKEKLEVEDDLQKVKHSQQITKVDDNTGTKP